MRNGRRVHKFGQHFHRRLDLQRGPLKSRLLPKLLEAVQDVRLEHVLLVEASTRCCGSEPVVPLGLLFCDETQVEELIYWFVLRAQSHEV